MLLPLGTVLYLKDGTVKVVVINRAIVFEVDGEQQLFEYEGCRFPEGSNGDDGRFYFNNSDIERLFIRVMRTRKNNVSSRYMPICLRKRRLS